MLKMWVQIPPPRPYKRNKNDSRTTSTTLEDARRA